MNILKQISIKNLKLNKKRTISTIIGIILSCALICAVATMVTSLQETLIQQSVSRRGYYHLKLIGVNENDINTLKNNRNVKEIKEINQIGYGFFETTKKETTPYLKLYSMNHSDFDELKLNLKEGRFPTNNNEIIVSESVIKNNNTKYKIGDKININIGERKTLEGNKLNYAPYMGNEERLVDTEKYEFTIVGIMERPYVSFEERSDPGYTIITTNLNKNNKEAYIILKNPKDYKNEIANILGVSNYDELDNEKIDVSKLKYENYSINTSLLRWEVFAFSDETVSMLYSVAGIVILIIILTSVFCIKNSFAIATTEKMKMYGMLASVGATKKQIRKNVIFECLILGIIAIPLGIVSGICAVYVLMQIVNSLVGSFLFDGIDGIIIKITFIPIVISIILGFVTIYLSAISSARKASKVSPIEALRNSDNIKIKAKKLKVPKIISKVFKVGGELAYKNLKRSKKKYKTTVISLSVSIFVFIAMNSFLTNALDLTNDFYKEYDYNVSIFWNYKDVDKEKDLKEIKDLNYIDQIYILYRAENELKISDLSKVNQLEGVELDKIEYYDNEGNFISNGEEKVATLNLVALDSEIFAKYAKKIGGDYEKIKNTGILCNNYMEYSSNGKVKDVDIYKYKIGDTINGKIKNKDNEFKVGAITKIRPYGLENTYSPGGFLVVNKDSFENIKFEPSAISIQSNNPYELTNEIENKNMGIECSNYEEYARQNNAISLIIKIFLYGFITVITLIGVTNIFNTITSNMELRQKEFAMLKSIGMTKKEFYRMINLETIFYSAKSLLYGIILGLIGNYAINIAFSEKIEKSIYIPSKPIIISIIGVFILVFIIMRYSIKKISKQNIIETIRKENI